MKKLFNLTSLAATALISTTLFAQQPLQLKPKLVYEPALRYQIPNRNPDMYTFNLKDIVKPNKTYQIWVDNNNVCTMAGQIKPGDINIRFVEILEPILLPPTPRIVYEDISKQNQQQKQSASKKQYTISPLSEKRLPDGRLEIKLMTPEGEQTITINGK